MSVTHPFLRELEDEASRHEAAEAEFRRTMRGKLEALTRERAFAFRRLNLLRSLFQTVAQADGREIAVAGAIAALRLRLGWRDDSQAREEVLARYALVAEAAFVAGREPSDGDEPNDRAPVVLAADGEPVKVPDPREALLAFEGWYEEARGKPFWILFEQYMPETPLVDF